MDISVSNRGSRRSRLIVPSLLQDPKYDTFRVTGLSPLYCVASVAVLNLRLNACAVMHSCPFRFVDYFCLRRCLSTFVDCSGSSSLSVEGGGVVFPTAHLWRGRVAALVPFKVCVFTFSRPPLYHVCYGNK